MRRVAVVTNIIPSYRKAFYEALLETWGEQLDIYCQREIPGSGIRNIAAEFGERTHFVRALSMKNESLAWQCLPLFRLLSYDVIYLYGNPRVLSNVVFSFLLKWLGKDVVIWGQAHTAGSNTKAEKLRLSWWARFKKIFTYTDAEVDYLRSRGFHNQMIIGMNNGLNLEDIDKQKSAWPNTAIQNFKEAKGLSNRTVFLSCARLIPKNKFEQVILALAEVQKTHSDFIWCVIGSGEEYEKLKALSEESGLGEKIVWVGALYRESQIAPWMLSSDVFLHPSAVGLSLIHAMSYQLPVITHSNASDQMPEFSAFEDSVTGLAFKQNITTDFAGKIVTLVNDRERARNMGVSAYRLVKDKYNTRVMAKRFLSFVELGERDPILVSRPSELHHD